MFRKKTFFAFPLLTLAIGYAFSIIEGDGGGSQAAATPETSSTVDVQAAIAQALAQKEAEHKAALKKATGFESFDELEQHRLKEQGKLQELADTHAAQANHFKSQFHSTLVKNSLLQASTDAIDSDVVHALLVDKAKVDDNGVVTIDGKPVKDAVAALLKDKPALAKATGSTGSGTPHSQSTQTTVDVSKMTPAQKMAHGRSQKGA
jgi:hypothetical protein